MLSFDSQLILIKLLGFCAGIIFHAGTSQNIERNIFQAPQAKTIFSSYYLREPPEAKTRTLSHTTSASLPARQKFEVLSHTTSASLPILKKKFTVKPRTKTPSVLLQVCYQKSRGNQREPKGYMAARTPMSPSVPLPRWEAIVFVFSRVLNLQREPYRYRC